MNNIAKIFKILSINIYKNLLFNKDIIFKFFYTI